MVYIWDKALPRKWKENLTFLTCRLASKTNFWGNGEIKYNSVSFPHPLYPVWVVVFFFFWCGGGVFLFFCLPHHVACRILVPQPGVEPGPQQWKQSPNHQTFIYLFGCAGLSCSTQDWQHVGPSSLTRDQIWAPCIGSTESWPLDHQRSPTS